MNLCRRSGFTLVEVMIVVVIMAILAATIIPQFTGSSDDARESTARFNAHTLQAQVHLYHAEHRAAFPSDLSKLTIGANINGGTGTDYGPYLSEIPENPHNGLNTVQVVTSGDGGRDDSHGWVYNSVTGAVTLDSAP